AGTPPAGSPRPAPAARRAAGSARTRRAWRPRSTGWRPGRPGRPGARRSATVGQLVAQEADHARPRLRAVGAGVEGGVGCPWATVPPFHARPQRDAQARPQPADADRERLVER